MSAPGGSARAESHTAGKTALTEWCAAEVASCLPQLQRLCSVARVGQEERPVQQHRPFLPQAAPRSVSTNAPDAEITTHSTAARATIFRSQRPCTAAVSWIS
jgi:hypothetical protein